MPFGNQAEPRPDSRTAPNVPSMFLQCVCWRQRPTAVHARNFPQIPAGSHQLHTKCTELCTQPGQSVSGSRLSEQAKSVRELMKQTHFSRQFQGAPRETLIIRMALVSSAIASMVAFASEQCGGRNEFRRRFWRKEQAKNFAVNFCVKSFHWKPSEESTTEKNVRRWLENN